MKKAFIPTLLLFLLSSLFSSRSIAQGHNGLYGNEWIEHTQQYFKIKVVEDGMYRISSSVLQNAGISVGSINPDHFQVFHEGQEVPILVEKSNNLVNYIQFYGKKNRGAYDVNVYNDASHHFNEEYSLYSDTAVYFLTWQNSPSNQHISEVSTTLGSPAEPYFMHTNKTVYSGEWNAGLYWPVASEQLTKSTFEYGEGFGSTLNLITNITIPTEHPYTGGPNATVNVKAFIPGYSSPHTLDIQSNGTTYGTYSFTNANIDNFTANFPVSTFQSGTTTVTVRGSVNAADKHHVAYGSITYPRTFDFDGEPIFSFSMPASTTEKHLSINNFDVTNIGAGQFYIYDLTNNIRIPVFANSNLLLTTLPISSVDRELVLINEGNTSSYTDVPGLIPVTFRDFSSSIFSPANYIIVTHPNLKTNSTNGNPIFDYRLYRQSPAGGSFITEEVDINELYDQFAYGIHGHPLAVRHFAHFIKKNWQNPEYIFLIGKGRIYNEVRTSAITSMLIPTFGYPPSDNVLLASIHTDEPAIAVGRLAATTGDQVSLYLQKIIDTEAQRNAPQTFEDKSWTKKILHLGGGKNNNEQNLIRNHLNSMKSIIEAPFYGGNVESFFKSSTNPIQVAQSSYLDSLINSGVSMITFFGHSSPNSFDFNLDHPQNYNNYQKYPLIMALGCYGGSIFESYTIISEDFIFEERAGAGVFLASAGAAALTPLSIFAKDFYRSLSDSLYNEGAAKSVKMAIKHLFNTNSNFYSTTTQMVCHYMSYHGDPAYGVSNASHPDYYIDETFVSHYPDVVTVQMNTFNLELDVYNLGKAIDTTFNIRIERTYPDGTTSFVLSQSVTAPLFMDHITIPIPIGTANSLGINKFNIYIDADDDVDEQPAPSAENNNTVLQYCVTILSDAVIPTHPYEFAIVPSTPITLKASTGNAFALAQTYRIQIDTTEYFNSPLMEETTITQVGGLLEWVPTMSYMDSTVYYWRTSIDSTSPASSYNWSTSSFIYLNGSYPGWNQSHFFQYLKDDRTNITIAEPDRSFKYINSIQNVVATTARTDPGNNPVLHPENVALYFNGSKLEKCRCDTKHGVYVAVIEPGTLNFWTLPTSGTLHGAINCNVNDPSPLFLFETAQSTGRTALKNFIDNVIPNGHYVLVFTLNNAHPLAWPTVGTDLVQTFTNQGVGQHLNTWIANSTATSTIPWGAFFKKGDLTYPYNISEVGTSPTSIISISGQLQEDWFQGNQTSTLIGPANYWGALYWDHSSQTNDHVNVSVYGVDANQNSRTLLIGPTTALDTALTNIDPTTYPYLELVWNSLDSIDKTSPQLDYWRVIADMVPEAALRPELFVKLDSSCIQQGQNIALDIAMENISPVDMDSMLVRFAIVGTNLQSYHRLDSLHSGDTLHASASFPSANLNGGTHQLLVEINPNNDQPEKYHFNNIGLASFEVKKDIINPILDVTFDGIHIMNKDIVSGTPEIIITLTDDNQYLGLDELEDFSVIVRHPSFPNGEMELSPTTTDMQFYPADPTKLTAENKAKIIIHPDLTADGTYTLFVSATDKTGNNSGSLSYSVDFEVINKPSISNMLNYPNPFTTSTQFVFTLTGRELPDYMKIQILTVTGKVVREITQEQLGPLRIGINRTEYAWDGRDEFGDQLANGVYLYRVITKKDGQDYEKYSNRTDYMFRQGFGKMYLMR